MHHEFDHDTSEIQKCINFYEHQLLLYLGNQPSKSEGNPGHRELETYEEIKVRRKIHETDDYVNLVCKEAIDNSMNGVERDLVRTMIIQNQKNKNRSIWKPQRLYLNKAVIEEIEKFESSNQELPP